MPMRSFFPVVLFALVFSACTTVHSQSSDVGTTPQSAPSSGEPLLILAAADLQFALPELARQFEASTGQKVTLSLGSTGNLTAQIENGAPADVFFAANESFVEQLERKRLTVDGTRQIYAVGRLAIVSAPGVALQAKTLEDLVRSEVRTVAIANPEHAPYGLAAQQALQSAGLWDRVQPKLVLGENISQTFQFVQTGNADAGLVALSVALGTPGTSYTLVDEALHAPLRQAVTVVKSSKQERAARQFVEFVNGAQGRPIMRTYGFVLPGE
jgi:molybdate transport system substrate-binding protein